MTTITRTRPGPESPAARCLSLPAPVELVENDGRGCAWLKLSDAWVRIESIQNLWEIDGYDRPGAPALRMHFRARTADGRNILLFQDLLEGRWYRQFTLGD